LPWYRWKIVYLALKTNCSLTIIFLCLCYILPLAWSKWIQFCHQCQRLCYVPSKVKNSCEFYISIIFDCDCYSLIFLKNFNTNEKYNQSQLKCKRSSNLPSSGKISIIESTASLILHGWDFSILYFLLDLDSIIPVLFAPIDILFFILTTHKSFTSFYQ
jgi:hypothetical protein